MVDRAADLLTKEALKEALENLSYRERIRQENQSLKKLQQLGEAQKLREVT